MQGFQHSHGNGLSQGAVLSAGTTTDQGSPAPVDLQYVKETKKNPKQGDIFCTVKTHTLGWLWDVGSPAFRPPRKGIFYTSVCSSEDFTPQWLIKVTRDHKGGALIQQDKCFYKKRKRQEGLTEIKGWVRAKPHSAVRKLRETAEETKPANTFLLKPQPLELWEIDFCSLSYSVCGVVWWQPKQTNTPGNRSLTSLPFSYCVWLSNIL